MRVRNADHPNCCLVPNIAGFDLGDGHIEMSAQPVFQTAYHLPLIFERLRMFNAQFECKKGDQRTVVGRWLSVAGQRRTTNDRFYAIASAATFSVTKASITSPALMSL